MIAVRCLVYSIWEL